MTKRAAIIVLTVSVASLLTPTPGGASDLPCAWVKYNLPQAGSNNVAPCSPVSRPPGWDAKITVKHNQPIIGAYFVEAGVTVPLPPGA